MLGVRVVCGAPHLLPFPIRPPTLSAPFPPHLAVPVQQGRLHQHDSGRAVRHLAGVRGGEQGGEGASHQLSAVAVQ